MKGIIMTANRIPRWYFSIKVFLTVLCFGFNFVLFAPYVRFNPLKDPLHQLATLHSDTLRDSLALVAFKPMSNWLRIL